MPRFSCPVHGTTGCAFVCEHVADDFRARRPLRESRAVRVTDGPGDPLAFTIQLCLSCLHMVAGSEQVTTLPWTASLEQFPVLDSPSVLCAECFQAYSSSSDPAPA